MAQSRPLPRTEHPFEPEEPPPTFKPPPLAPINQPKPDEPNSDVVTTNRDSNPDVVTTNRSVSTKVEVEEPLHAELSKFKDPELRRKMVLAVLAILVPVLLAVVAGAKDSFVAWLQRDSNEKLAQALKAAADAHKEATECKTEARQNTRDIARLEGILQGYWERQGFKVRRPPDMAPPLPVEITPAPREPRRTALQPKPEIRLPATPPPGPNGPPR